MRKDLAEPLISLEEEDRAMIDNDLECRIEAQFTHGDVVDIGWDHPDTMRVVSRQIGANEMVGHEIGRGVRGPGGEEDGMYGVSEITLRYGPECDAHGRVA